MALDKIQVTVEPVLNSTSLDAAINRVQGKTIKVKAEVQDANFEQKIGRPLGRITGQVDEFKKSLDAANARVLAFGASVGVIGLISNAFKDLINSTIEVEKNLALLKVTGDKSFSSLEKTGRGVFEIAKEIGVSFADATNATIEFSRQGKNLQQSLDAARAALVLVKTTGLDAVSSVNGLTTAVNAFSDSGITYADVVNKMAAVDTKFAVNSKDLIEGIGRSASVAQQAGVSFNELLGFITALQEKTGRGGPVIGNAIKTIFTRIQNPAIINQLREFNIELQDTEGNSLNAVQILKNFAKEFDKLKNNDKARAILDVGGTFQIDKLAALIKDLSSANSKFDQATATSSKAKNEAYGKVLELNKTLDASLTKLNTSAKEFGSTIGSIAFADSFKETLNYISSKFDSLNQSISGTKTLEERLASGDEGGEKSGATLGKAILKGIGAVVSGPGLLLLGGILIKLTADFAKFSASGLQTLLGITTKSKEEESIQNSIVEKLKNNLSLQKGLYALGDDKIAQNKELLRLYTEQYNANKKLTDLAKGAAPALYENGVRLTGGELTVKNLQTTTKASASANGYVPNFNSLNEAVSYEKANMPAGASVKINKNFPFGNGKFGTMVSNTSETEIPNFMNTGGTAIIPKYKNAISGYVPNFADKEKRKEPTTINEFQIDAEKYGIAGLTLGSDSFNLKRSKAKVLKDNKGQPTKWVRDNFSDSPIFDSLMNYDKAVVTNLPVGGVYKASKTLKGSEADVKANFVDRLNQQIGSSSLAFLINEINSLGIPLTNSFKDKLYSTKVGNLNLIDNGQAGNFFEKVVKLPLMQNERDIGFKKETGSNFDIYGLSAPDAKAYGLPDRSFRYGEVKFSLRDLDDDITEKFLNQAKIEIGGSIIPKTAKKTSSAAKGYIPNFSETKLGEGYSASFYDLGSGIGEKRFKPEFLEEEPKKVKTEADISKKLAELNSKLKIVRFPKIFGSTATSIKKEVVTDPLAAKVFDDAKGPSDVKKMLERRLQETLRIALAPVQIAGIVPQDLNANNYTVNSNIQTLLGNILNSDSGIPSAEDLYRQINTSGGMMTMIDPGEFYKDKPNKKELEKFQKYKEQGLLENASNGYVPNFAIGDKLKSGLPILKELAVNSIEGFLGLPDKSIDMILEALAAAGQSLDHLLDIGVNDLAKRREYVIERMLKKGYWSADGGDSWTNKKTGKTYSNPKKIGKIAARAADGYIPNFSKKAVQDAIEREQKQSGLPLSAISVIRDNRVANPNNPNGFAVINKRDEPNGKVPNFADRSAGDLFEDLGGKLTPEIAENVKATKALTEAVKKLITIPSFSASAGSSKGSGYLGATAMYGSSQVALKKNESSTLLIPQGQSYDLSKTADKDFLTKEENLKRIQERIKQNSFSIPASPAARIPQQDLSYTATPINPNNQKFANKFLSQNFASELFPFSTPNPEAEAKALQFRPKPFKENITKIEGGINRNLNESRLVSYAQRGEYAPPATIFEDLKKSVLKNKETFNYFTAEISLLTKLIQDDGKEAKNFKEELVETTKRMQAAGIDITSKVLENITKGTAFEQTEKSKSKPKQITAGDALIQRMTSLSESNPSGEKIFQMQAQAFAAARQQQRYAQYAQAQTNVYGSLASPNISRPTTQSEVQRSLFDRMREGVGSVIGSSKVLTEQEKAQKLEKDKLIAQEKANKSIQESFATIMKWQTGIAALTGAVSVLGEGATVAATSIGSLFNSVILAKEGMSGAKDILGKTTYEYTTASGEKRTGERNKTFGESFSAIGKKFDEGKGTGTGAGTGILGFVDGIKNAKGEIGTFAKAAGVAALSWGTVAFQAIQNIDQIWKYLDNGAEKSKKAIARVAEIQDKYNISLGRSQESVAKMISVIGNSDTEGFMGAMTRAGIIFGRESFSGQDKQSTALAQFKFGNEGTKAVADEISKIMAATASSQMSEEDKKNPIKVAIQASKLQGNFLNEIIDKYSKDVVVEKQVPMTPEELKAESFLDKLAKISAATAGPGSGVALPGMKLETKTERVVDENRTAEMQAKLFDNLQKQAQTVLPKIYEEEKRRASILGVSVDALKAQLDLYTKITKAINDTKTGLEFNLEIEKDDLGTTQKRKDQIELQLKLLQKEKEIRSQKNDVASSVSQKEIFDRLKNAPGGLTEVDFKTYSDSFKSINLGIEKGDTSSQSAEKLFALLGSLGVQSAQLKQEATDILNSQLSTIDTVGNKDKLLLKLETDKLQISRFFKYEQDQIKERLEAQLNISQKNLAVRKEEATIAQNIKDLQFKTSIAAFGPRTQELATRQREPEAQLAKDEQALQFRREEAFQSTKRNVINYVTQSNPEIFKDEKAAAALYGSKTTSDLKDALTKVKQFQEEQVKIDPIKLSGDYFNDKIKIATNTLESTFDTIGKKFAEKLGLPSFDINKPAELKLRKQINEDNFESKSKNYSDTEMTKLSPLSLSPIGIDSLSNPLGANLSKPISLGKTDFSQSAPFDASDLFSKLTPPNSSKLFKETEIGLRSVDSTLKTSADTAAKTADSAKKAEQAISKTNIDEFFKSFVESLPKNLQDEIKAKYNLAKTDREIFTRRSTTFSGGMEESKIKMDEDIKYFNNTLGKQIPNDFASSMKDALKELANPNSTEPLKNRLLGVANSFLLKIQDAFMTQAANQLTSGIMGGFGVGGKATGGPIVGGSGVKDDVPTMLMGGEYVIKKSAAQKYGPEFLSALNKGSIKKFANGGFVESDITKYQDASKMNPYGQTRDEGLSFDASGKVIGMDSYTGTADNKEDAMRKAQSDYYYKNAQNGEGGFYVPGQNGMGAIMGQKNLLAFATQQSAGTKFDKFSSGANSAGIDLGAGSANMSLFALRNQGNSKNIEYSESKQKALDLYLGGIDASKEKANKEEDIRRDIEKAIQEYKTAERKQYQSIIRNFVISAAMAGISYAGNKMMTTGGQEAQSAKIESINAEIDTKGWSNQGISQSGEIYSASNRASIDNTRITGGEKFFGYEGKGGFFRGSLSGDNNKFISNDKGMYSWDGGGYSRMGNNSLSNNQWAQMNYSAKPIQIGGQTYYPASMGRRAAGGYVPGNGMGDNVPTMLNGGEFVVSKQAAQNIGINKLQQINSGSKSADISQELLSKLDELVEKLSAVGTLNITVNSDSNGKEKSSKESSNNQDQQTKDLAKKIKDVVLGVLRDEKRLGGMLR